LFVIYQVVVARIYSSEKPIVIENEKVGKGKDFTFNVSKTTGTNFRAMVASRSALELLSLALELSFT